MLNLHQRATQQRISNQAKEPEKLEAAREAGNTEFEKYRTNIDDRAYRL